jgi:hypothetical protein
VIAQLRADSKAQSEGLAAQVSENVRLRIQISQMEMELKALRSEKCDDEASIDAASSINEVDNARQA